MPEPTTKPCTDPAGCDREAKCRGLCMRHYNAARKRGTLDAHQTVSARRLGVAASAAAAVDLDADTERLVRILSNRRRRQGLSRETVGNVMGHLLKNSGQVALGRWENDEHLPNLRSFVAWAAALGFRVELMPVTEESPSSPTPGWSA